MTQLEIEVKNRYGVSRGDDTQETSGLNMQRAQDFIEGYHQAEKDLELTVDDIMKLDALLIEMWNQSGNKYQEVLKRFNKERKEKCQ